MSILLTPESRVICQGITGAQGSFHSQKALDCSTNLLGGVTPDKGGMVHLGLPIFNTVAEAKAATDCNATGIFVPPPFAADAIKEAIEAEIELIVCITDGIPARDMQDVKRVLKGSKSTMIGSNCPGIITPGVGKIGIIPAYICQKGSIGIISRSGTLSYEASLQTCKAGLGQSTVVGIGGDLVIGIGYAKLMELFLDDDETEGIIIIGEVGGNEEIKAAEFIKEMGSARKPIAAFLAGASAPEGRRLGHAGAIVSKGEDSIAMKKQALLSVGVEISETITGIGEAMKKAMQEFK